MWTTSWEKKQVNKCANDYLKGSINRWYTDGWYRQRDPNIQMKVMIWNNICYIIRDKLQMLPEGNPTLIDALNTFSIDDVKLELQNNGVREEFTPGIPWLTMMTETVIPCFLARRKEYVANEEIDESLPPRLFDDGDYAMLKGEACRFNRDHRGFKVYKAIYAGESYIRSEFRDNQGRLADYACYKNCYRAYNPETEVVLKGDNLADIKERISRYLRGEIDE